MKFKVIEENERQFKRQFGSDYVYSLEYNTEWWSLSCSKSDLKFLHQEIYIQILFKEVVTPFPITESIVLGPISLRAYH